MPTPFLVDTIPNWTAHNTTANANYTRVNFPSNFTGLTWVDQGGTHLFVNTAISDDGFNPVTPANLSAIDVKTLTPNCFRTMLVVPYNFDSAPVGNVHRNYGIDTDSQQWADGVVARLKRQKYDALTVDWYGPGRNEDIVTLCLKTAVAKQPVGAFYFDLMLDSTGGSPSTGGVLYTTTAQLIALLQYMETNYFPDPRYRMINGKKVVYLWGASVPGVDYAAAKAAIATPMYFVGQGPGQLANAWIDGIFDWVQPFLSGVNALDRYNLAAKQSFLNSATAGGVTKGFVVSVSGRFNGYGTRPSNWSLGKYLPGDWGECWIQHNALAAAYTSRSNCIGVMDATLNDHEEGTQLEAGIDNGIVVSSSNFGSVLNWNVSRIDGTAANERAIYNYVLLATPASDGYNCGTIAIVAKGGSNSVDLSTFRGWNSGTQYRIYVIAQGIAGVINRWNSTFLYTPNFSGGPGVTVSIVPPSLNMLVNGTQQFTAVVSGSNTAVTWAAGGGSITAGGLYTAPSVAGPCIVTATSVADPTQIATAQINVATIPVPPPPPPPPPISLTPKGYGYIGINDAKRQSYSQFFLNSSSSVVELETLEIYHPSFSRTYRLVRNAINGIIATLEDGSAQQFDYYPVSITPTGANNDLDQTLQISFGDLGAVLPMELDRIVVATTQLPNVGALLGVFTDAVGNIIGTPFLVGTRVSVWVPAGASYLSLGINDTQLIDNWDGYTVSVNGAAGVFVDAKSQPWSLAGGLNAAFPYTIIGATLPSVRIPVTGGLLQVISSGTAAISGLLRPAPNQFFDANGNPFFPTSAGDGTPGNNIPLSPSPGTFIKPSVLYRTYRSDDLSGPLAGPYRFDVSNIAFQKEGATLNCSAPRLNLNTTGELYTMERFPSLRGFL